MKKMLLLSLCVFTSVHADDAAIKTRLAGMARKVVMEGHQVSAMGIRGDVRVYKPRLNPSKNKGAEKWLWEFEEKQHAVLRGVPKPTQSTHRETNPGMRDIITTVFPWNGKAWRIGWVTYRTIEGAGLRVPLWTASETEAVDFYRKHGFTVAARDAVMDNTRR